ncbi:MAG: HEAT repeat domain-containing protein [Methanomicrobiaceae archaeon]|nr:HEAT repeat domain-containing protein [Methanomicrobiaceae archaeon]
MRVVDIDSMKAAGDVEGLLAALCDDEEYIRAKAAEALAGFTDQNVAEALEKLKFEDPSTDVKESASRAHAMVMQRIEEKKEKMV